MLKVVSASGVFSMGEKQVIQAETFERFTPQNHHLWTPEEPLK